MVSMRAIREFSKQVEEEYHPERIVLFGSYAEGHPSADSAAFALVALGK
ncbi:MAG: hypothetical protein Q7T82_20590 [Armatimonadota bacterium]|nr:hypothetical protein [Armatimonadota bacterium]